MRIVSLFPAATEIVCAAGLSRRLVGISHLCDYPPEICGLSRVTACRVDLGARSRDIDAAVRRHAADGLYRLDAALLARLRPDAIVTQSLCDVCAVSEREVQEAVQALARRPAIVQLSPHTLSDVLNGILQVAALGGEPAVRRARRTVDLLRRRLDTVATDAESEDPKQVLVLEWLDPPFSAGHWTPEIVRRAGGASVLANPGERSQPLTWEALCGQCPEVIVVAACGRSIEQTCGELQAMLNERHPVADLIDRSRRGAWVVDGDRFFNRPGPRLVACAEWLAHLLQTGIAPTDGPLRSVHIPSKSLGIPADAALRRPTT